MKTNDTLPDGVGRLGVGRVIGERYALVRLIGEGGMGQVFEAEHVSLGRRFALKVLRLERWSNELVLRFEREARALGKIQSARVAAVTDFGIEPNVGPYFVMELLDGEVLEDRIQREPRLPIEQVLAIGEDVAAALVDVHAAGIVHRDIKPSNIGLPRNGPVLAKLLDFGLAASVDDSFLERITRSQQVLGSLPYMAPEQFAGARPTFSIDLYALGVVLYEASAGRLPFLAPSAAALIHHILASPPQHIGATRPEIPPELDGLIARLLAKDPNERFPSAGALLDAFSELRRGTARPTHPSKHPSSRPPAPSSLPPTRYVQTPIPMGADIPPLASALAAPPLPSAIGDYPSGIPPHASSVAPGFDPMHAVHPIPPTTAMPSPESRFRREADWSSGQVVPPTSYPSGSQQRSRTSPLFFLLVAAIGIAAFAVVALVTVVVLTASSPKATGVQPVAVEPITVSVVEPDAGPAAIVEVEIPDAGPGAVVEERPRDAGRRGLGVRAMTPDPPDPPPPPNMRGMWTGEIIEAPF